MPPVFRFAPTPNGYLHLGHALSALLNFDMARAAGGRLLLRIEDIDATRCRPEYEAAIYEDLRLARPGLGSSRCGGSPSISTTTAPRSAQLEAMGLIYPSFESRAEIARLVAATATCAERLAARSRRRAALSGRCKADVGAGPAAAHRCRRALCAAARHGDGDGARRRADVV